MNFNEEYELDEKTCLALLLQFKIPIVYDLTMPDSTDIGRLVVLSGRILNGEEIKPEEITCVTANPRYDKRQYLKKGKFFVSLSPKVSKGIEEVLLDDRESDSFLSHMMIYSGHLLSNEWYPEKGTLYRFREGQRFETEKQVQAYFKIDELADFDKIGNAFQPFIERVSAPHPCT